VATKALPFTTVAASLVSIHGAYHSVLDTGKPLEVPAAKADVIEELMAVLQ
jgi:hypothetical protein